MSKNQSKKILTKKETPKPKQKFIIQKWHKILIAIFLIFILLPISLILAYEQIYTEKIYPGIRVGDLKLGGITKEEALFALDQAVQIFNDEGIIFIYQDKKVALTPIITAANDPDLSRTIFILETQKTVDEAFGLGRNGDFFDNIKNQLQFLLYKQKIFLKYQHDTGEIEKILKENFAPFEKPALDAKLVVTETKTSEKSSESVLETSVTPEKEGVIFNYEQAVSSAFQNITELKNEPTFLSFIVDKPKINLRDTLSARERAEKLTKICSLTIAEGTKKWVVSQSQIRGWLAFQTTSEGVAVGFDKEKVQKYLNSLLEEINIQSQNAKFKVENGVVKEFQIHQGGKELDLEASYHTINNHILDFDIAKIIADCPKNPKPEESDVIELIVKITAPQIPISSVNNLGVKELVGGGTSNFAGSPVNRRYNIKVGAAKLNGVLIAPGEEFSTNKAIGEVSGATGYLPELVIKGDRTIPEYGGGLCQIGTTMFRVALDAGLPITERRPHSYRVVYYEPAGMDATIYSPKPDLKFINDTPAYLLLQTKIDGDELTFEFWGTPDGRKVELSEPKIYNFVGPGPTKIVETEDLAPGEKKCTERAHTGADAEFSRTITYSNGETKTETWTSHYVPWSAVCLVGKEPSPPPEEKLPPPSEETPVENTSPPSNVNTNTPPQTF